MTASIAAVVALQIVFRREVAWQYHHSAGVVAHERGDVGAAAHHFRRSAEHARRIGSGDNRLGQALSNQAALLVAQGHDERAVELYREAIASYRTSTGPGPNRSAQVQGELEVIEARLLHAANGCSVDPAVLVEASLRGDLVLFIGSAVSIFAPASLPSFSTMREAVIEAVTDRLSGCLELPDRSRFAALSPETLYAALHFVLGDRFLASHDVLRGRRPNACHRALAALLRDPRRAPILLTTNFDELIERALDEAGNRRRVDYFVYHDSKGFQEFSKRYAAQTLSGISIVKLHGTIGDPASIRARLDEIATGLSPFQSTALGAVLANERILFVGYSGNDSDVFPKLIATETSSIRGLCWNIRPGEGVGANLERLSRAHRDKVQFCEADLRDLLARLVGDGALGEPPVVSSEGDGAAVGSGARPLDGEWARFLEPYEAAEIVGRWCLSLRENKVAQCLFEAAEALSRAASADAAARVRVIVSLAMISGERTARLARLGEALEIATDDGVRRHVLRHRVDVECDSGDMEQALALLEKCAEFPIDFIRAGHLHRRRGDWGAAAAAYIRARALISEKDGPGTIGIGNIESILGVFHHERREYSKAVEHHHRALEVYRHLGFVAGAALTMRNLAVTHHEWGHKAHAHHHWDEAFRLAWLLFDVTGMAAVADACDCVGEFDAAFAYYQRLLGFVSRRQNLSRVGAAAYVFENTSGLHWGQYDVDSAILEEAIMTADRTGIMAFCWNKMGEIRGNNGDLAGAAACLRAAADLLREIPAGTSVALRREVRKNRASLPIVAAR